jgi:hypothetical protein
VTCKCKERQLIVSYAYSDNTPGSVRTGSILSRWLEIENTRIDASEMRFLRPPLGVSLRDTIGSTDKTKLNSVALVRERTIPTERPPLIGEVSADFCG